MVQEVDKAVAVLEEAKVAQGAVVLIRSPKPVFNILRAGGRVIFQVPEVVVKAAEAKEVEVVPAVEPTVLLVVQEEPAVVLL